MQFNLPVQTRVLQIILILAVIGILALSIQLSPTPISFRVFELQDVVDLLTGITLIALFLERALEVFVTTLRGPDSNRRENNLKQLQEQITRLEGDVSQAADRTVLEKELDTARQEFDKARNEMGEFKSETQRMALWISLFLALGVSLAGTRTLEPLVNADELLATSSFQRGAFHMLDVLLTGGMIAGGSEGLHKITSLFTTYFEVARANAKKG